MKAAVVAKFIQTLAAILLVMPFLAGAIFVGHWAVTVAERASHNLLFAALALSGIAIGVAQGRPSGTALSWPVPRRNRL